MPQQSKRLTLAEAAATGRLDEFVRQEEARGIGPGDVDELNVLITKAVKPQREKGQTSRYELAKKFGVHNTTILAAKRHRTWKHIS